MLLAARAVEARAEEMATTTASSAVAYSSDRGPPETARRYYLRGTARFRTLAINDEDPANGRSMLYGVELGYRVTSQLTVFARTGLTQRFVVPSTDTSRLTEQQARFIGTRSNDLITSPFLIRDSVAGAAYRHTLKLGLKNGDVPINFAHYLNLYIPTSIASQDRGLYFAPEALTRARWQALDDLTLGADLGLQYRFHKYAEQYGPNGGLLTQYQVATALLVDYALADFGEAWGRMDAGGGVSWAWQNTYDSIDGHDAWRQDYGWDVYLFYTPRAWLSMGVSLEQGAPVLRDGRVNTVLFHRDETELVFTVQATY
jgi:hypothetical protein